MVDDEIGALTGIVPLLPSADLGAFLPALERTALLVKSHAEASSEASSETSSGPPGVELS